MQLFMSKTSILVSDPYPEPERLFRILIVLPIIYNLMAPSLGDREHLANSGLTLFPDGYTVYYLTATRFASSGEII